MSPAIHPLLTAAASEHPAVVEKLTKLVDAALAFGIADAAYTAATDEWRKAHPDDDAKNRDGESAVEMPSWQAMAGPACHGTIGARGAMQEAARALHNEAEALKSAPPAAPCADCSKPTTRGSGGEVLCLPCETERHFDADARSF